MIKKCWRQVKQYARLYGRQLRFSALGILFVILIVLIIIDQKTANQPDPGAILTDAYDEVNELVNSYYTSVAAGDTDSLKKIVVPFTTADEQAVTHKSTLVESYDNIKCYTHKKGVTKNYYIVFAYYEIRFPDVQTPVPGMETHFICRDSEGKLYINNDPERLTESQKNRLQTVLGKIETEALFDEVETSFAMALSSDEGVYNFVEALDEDLAKSADALKDKNKDTAGESGELKLGETDPPKTAGDVKKTQVAVINLDLYESDDTASTVVSVIPVGSGVYVDSNKENGFSAVTYNNITGYVESKYVYNSIDVNDTVTGSCAYYASCSSVIDPMGNLEAGQSYERTRYFGNGYSEVKLNDTYVYVKTEELDH